MRFLCGYGDECMYTRVIEADSAEDAAQEYADDGAIDGAWDGEPEIDVYVAPLDDVGNAIDGEGCCIAVEC